MSAVPEVEVAELPADAVLIDVREDDEWQAGHAPGRPAPADEPAGRAAGRRPGRRPALRDLPLRCPVRPGWSRSSTSRAAPSVNVAGGMQSWAARGGPWSPSTAAPRTSSRPGVSTPGAPATCPRCGRSSAPASGPFCPHCGRYLAPLRWVAEPPRSALRFPLPLPRPRYAGPPRYRVPSRGGASPPARGAPPTRSRAAPDPLHAARSTLGLLVAAALGHRGGRPARGGRRGVALRAAAGQPGRRAVRRAWCGLRRPGGRGRLGGAGGRRAGRAAAGALDAARHRGRGRAGRRPPAPLGAHDRGSAGWSRG